MAASTLGYLQGPGQSAILQTTSTAAAGNWIPVHPSIRNLTVQAIETGSSVGVSVSGNVSIQVSNDGVNPIISTAGIISFSSLASPASDGFSIDAHWNFVRAYLNANTTMSSGSSVTVLLSGHYLD